MTNSTRLERRYRRLLALYPKAVRREQDEEILAVLMAAAAEGQQRPRVAETIDLLKNAIFMRLQQARLPGPWAYRHSSLMLPVRVLIGCWLVFLTAILYGYGVGGFWGVLLVPAAALHFFIAYRLRHDPEPAPPDRAQERGRA
jgi:hypothetical protein